MKHLNSDHIEALAKQALDDSVDHLDAYTLSCLNQSRQRALAFSEQSRPWTIERWLPTVTASSLAIALTIILFLPNEQAAETGSYFSEALEIDASLVVMEDRELLEDLDMMLWLLDEESHAS